MRINSHVYYNEIDPFCCKWLAELMKQGLIPEGEIDSRSIEDVKPDELKGFSQCHFFAGIGGWAYAAKLAGWEWGGTLWTGSCPCQPFSTAGKRAGTSDERHLWPAFFWLISQCKPDIVFGEQVASKDALAWLDLVHSDLENAGYACGVSDTCAAGFGAPHIRQRLYWCALGHATDFRYWERVVGNETAAQSGPSCSGEDERRWRYDFANDGGTDGVAYSQSKGLQRQPESDRGSQGWQEQTGCSVNSGDVAGGLDNSESRGRQHEPSVAGISGTQHGQEQSGERACGASADALRTMPTNGFWANPDWLWCRDKKWRPIKPGLVPLVDVLPKGVGLGRDFRAIKQRLKGYGNAIVIPQAVEFIEAVKEAIYGAAKTKNCGDLSPVWL